MSTFDAEPIFDDDESKFEVLQAKPWNITELILAEALNVGPVKPSNLKATANFPLHTFFAREYWQSVRDEDYNILLPSMQLASNLLQVGMPYLSSFVPSSRVHDHLTGVRPSLTTLLQVDMEDWTEKDMEKTRDGLHDIADCVEWELNDTMAKDNRWLGITRLVTDDKWGPRPWRDLQREDIIRSDNELRNQGVAFRRNLRVGIMKEYVDALKRYSNTTEEHLRAAFLAAVTMTHEIGHVVWHQDFRSTSYEINGVEPYIENYSISELGCSFIASIFDGKNPFECGKQVPTDFTRALYWERVPTFETDELYRKDCSMSIPYIQKVLSQESWDRLDPSRSDFVTNSRSMLQPEEDTVHTSNSLGGKSLGSKEPPATAHNREWTVIDIYTNPKLIWKMEFSDRRSRSNEKLERVTQAEKALAIYEILQTLSPIAPNYLRHNHSDFDYSRPIDDGVVTLDLVGSGPTIDLNNLKRIEIRYRPKPGDFKEQVDHHTHLQRHQARVGARLGATISRLDWFSSLDADPQGYDKDVPKDFQFGGPGEEYEPADVLALIANKQPEVIAKTTVKNAYQFCMERNIRSDRRLPVTHAEQNQKLDRTKEDDRALIERMRQFCLETAERLFAGNNQALLYIYYAKMKYINDWSRKDLEERCNFDGLNRTGTLAAIQQRVRDNMTECLRMFAKDHNMSSEEEVFRKVGLVDEVDLVTWTNSDFIDFFRINNLPAWGNRRIWFERYGAFVREQKYGLARRSDINHDSRGKIQRSVNLVESYAWDVVLAGSSVQALKGSLFEAGLFPADSTLNLYCGKARQLSLEDDKPLSYYEPECWKTISLEITRTSQEEKSDTEMLDVEPPVLVYKPRIPDGIDISSSPTVDHERWGVYGPGQRLGNTGDPLSSATDGEDISNKPGIPKDVQRIYDLAHGKARPTVTERLDEIHTHAEELTRILHPLGARDTLRPHLKMLRSTSAVEMLDSYEDMKEVREDRQRHIDMQVDPEAVIEQDRRKRIKLLQELRPDLEFEASGKLVRRPVELKKKKKVGGFMGDMYTALKNRNGVL
ncbi:hypothetical protein BKA61DRAFT_671251 [Leptodontidium sp. MPI-SDFR-AT-0119]|nr:hypothetical protein BKA61DRAFT_671251 [Leptodontidium sp. MPI-SDFR-AT-0119]